MGNIKINSKNITEILSVELKKNHKIIVVNLHVMVAAIPLFMT